MNAAAVLTSFNRAGVDYLLIGGMNFLLRHQPVLTFDIDFWIKDESNNRRRCERALSAIDAEWGADDETWGPVGRLAPGWLDRQPVFCLTSPHGAVDIFRKISGLDDWDSAFSRGTTEKTAEGVEFRSLSDGDMLTCQLALSEGDRKLDRIAYLRKLADRI